METIKSKALVGRYVPGGHYTKDFIGQVVGEVLKGKPRQMVQMEYGLPRTTLLRWLKDVDLAVKRERIGPRPAPDLKRSAANAVQSGRLSMREALLTYGVKTEQTIRRWIEQIEQENADLVAQNKGPMDKDRSASKASIENNADVKALQKALEEAQLKVAALNTLIDVAEEQLKINIRKKPGAKQSSD
jgi:transposase